MSSEAWSLPQHSFLLRQPRSRHQQVQANGVFQLIAEGKANKKTAAELGISSKTIEEHRNKVVSKLNIHAIGVGIIESRVQLTIVQRCRGNGWAGASSSASRGVLHPAAMDLRSSSCLAPNRALSTQHRGRRRMNASSDGVNTP